MGPSFLPCMALPTPVPFAIAAVMGLVGFHANGLKRILDALRELLDSDFEKRTFGARPLSFSRCYVLRFALTIS